MAEYTSAQDAMAVLWGLVTGKAIADSAESPIECQLASALVTRCAHMSPPGEWLVPVVWRPRGRVRLLSPAAERMEDLIDTPKAEPLLLPIKGAPVHIVPQVSIGRFRVDYLLAMAPSLGAGFHLLVVECDGRAFHNKERDRARDDEIFDLVGIDVVRFTGSQIYKSPLRCAEDALTRLRSASGYFWEAAELA